MIRIGKFSFYSDISEITQNRFIKFQQSVLVESGVGSSLSDLDTHLSKITLFLQQKDNDKAIEELKNLRQCFFFIEKMVDTKCLCLAALEASTQINDEDIKKTASDIAATLSPSQISEVCEMIKKKFMQI